MVDLDYLKACNCLPLVIKTTLLHNLIIYLRMIHCTLSCVSYITTLYDSMEASGWLGFDKWMCFRCGKKFTLSKYVAYNRSNLLLALSDCPHPACSVCDRCYKWYLGATLMTDFQQFNLFRVGHDPVPLTDDILLSFTNVSDIKSNKCFLFNLLVCFVRAKIFKHAFDYDGALTSLTLNVFCSLQIVYDTIGEWSRDDFIRLARKLDEAKDYHMAGQLLATVYESYL